MKTQEIKRLEHLTCLRIRQAVERQRANHTTYESYCDAVGALREFVEVLGYQDVIGEFDKVLRDESLPYADDIDEQTTKIIKGDRDETE